MTTLRFQNASEYAAALAQAVAEAKGFKVEALSGVSCSAYVGGVRFSDHSDFVQRSERETIRIDGTFTKVYADMLDGSVVTEDDLEEMSRDEREMFEYAGIYVDRATFDSLVAEGINHA